MIRRSARFKTNGRRGHRPQKPITALNKGERVKPFLGAMANNMTSDEYWAHPTTRCEIELLQETLRGVAYELGKKHFAFHLPRLTLILENVRSRLARLERDVEDPPTHSALSLSSLGGAVREAVR